MLAATSDIMGQLSASEPVSQANEGSASVLDVVGSTARLSNELDRNCFPTGSSWAWQARGRRSTAQQRDRHLPAVELADSSKFHGKSSSSSLPLAAGEGR